MVDEKGKNLGIMETSEALRIAQERGLDLIEITPTTQPPVCKIIDFGKFKYQREKGEREHGKKQTEVELKGIRIGFTTGKHDLERYAKKAAEFIKEGNKVRVNMRLRGREKAHGSLALQKFSGFLEMIPVDINLDQSPKRFPQGFIAIISKK